MGETGAMLTPPQAATWGEVKVGGHVHNGLKGQDRHLDRAA